MDSKTNIALIFFVLLSFLGFGQDSAKEEFKATMKKVAKVYSAENIKIKYSREIFESASAEIPMESNKGIICIGSKKKYRVEENGTLVIQNEQFKMSVDSTEMLVLISTIDENILSNNIAEMDKDSVLVDYTVQKRFVKNQIIYELTAKNDLSTSITLVLNKTSLEIVSMSYFMPASNYFSETLNDESLEKPVLVIKYEAPEKIKDSPELYVTKNWIVSNDIPLELTAKAKGFVIYDTRLSSH